MRHRATLALLFAFALAFFGATRLQAQPRPGTSAQETDDEVKVNTYKKFVENREPNPVVAYEAAKDYMRRYGKEDDQYTRYFKVWIPAFEDDERARRLAAEREDREQRLLQAVTQKRFADAYAQAKQVLNDDATNVKVLIPLGYSAVIATTEFKNENFNADAAAYAHRALQLIESGKAPDSWSPFKNKEDVLASLNYAIGFYLHKSNPDDAIASLIRAAQIDSDRRTAPSTYYYLALAYQSGPYKRLSADYGARFANKPETPEGKTALDNLYKVVDKIIDAYARAVALAGNDPQNQKAKAAWMQLLTDFYKFRHETSDAGLNELIAGVLAKPLPQP
jgi:tetratricopeptide (TPR) repeat protein